MKIRFQSGTCHLAEIRAQARAFLSGSGFDECSTELMVLALDEACTNVIRHAYGHACRPVSLEMTALRTKVRLVLRDYGRSCDPARIKSRALDDIRPGGLGVHIIRQAFDTVSYLPQRRGTRLVLEKARPGGASKNAPQPPCLPA